MTKGFLKKKLKSKKEKLLSSTFSFTEYSQSHHHLRTQNIQFLHIINITNITHKFFIILIIFTDFYLILNLS